MRDDVPEDPRPNVLLCGPPLSALGGGPTHMKNMLASPLMQSFKLVHFEAGSRGAESPAKDESALDKLWRALTSPVALAIQILRMRPIVVHINSAVSHRAFWRDLVYLLISKSLRRPVVLQLHGGSISLQAFCATRFMRRLARLVYSMPDVLVLLATSEKRDFGQLGAGERAVVIANGIDVVEYRGRERVHTGQVKRLAYLGRLFRPKGVFEAIEAVDVLRRKSSFRDIELLLAGSGPAHDEIEKFIQDRNLGGHVRLVGPLHGNGKIEFLREADIFVFPSYHQEGLPYAILESLAAGTPVIASGVAGIPDVVTDRVHGILIEPRDPGQIVAAVEELAQSPDHVRSMSRNCAEWAWQTLSLERLAHQFAEIYRALDDAGNRKRGGSPLSSRPVANASSTRSSHPSDN